MKLKAVYSFETSGGSYPTTRHNDPEDMVSRYESRFVTKFLGPVSFPVGNAPSFPRYLSQIFGCSLSSLSLSLYQ